MLVDAKRLGERQIGPERVHLVIGADNVEAELLVREVPMGKKHEGKLKRAAARAKIDVRRG